MSKRDFFIIVIRIFGLYFLVATLFSTLPGMLSFGAQFGDSATIALVVLSAVASIVFFWLLIYKAHKMVDFLKLGNGFEDNRIELGRLSSVQLTGVAILVIGGILIVENLPRFLSEVISSFKSLQFAFIGEGNGYSWIMPALNLIIGYLLLTNYQAVALWMMRKKDEGN
jgi:hypothetical protein